ncbi:MAG: UDP-N-acetylglucosamine--N-acetylmuramyl-(pentapeptide) pyrophosphoryl-undecaprenol N-acetylglucosamine transferase [Anaerolineaceae bacterium]|nr:UDP-N-acetylglucosamine--N-acetylmuramyl-(pentapeptide) pyrophosphoryl-undecaprenol N-acetylglucosamine transferase [Anaerolineaceae bacterium]
MYPALAVLQTLAGEADPVLWVGGKGGMEAELVQRAGIAFTAIPAAGLHGVSLPVLPKNMWQLARGTREAGRVLHSFQPDLIFLTGGFVGVPMALAGHNIPTLLYVPDIEPGLALKAMARFADQIAVTAEDSRGYFSHSQRVIVTGYPTRPDLSHWERASAREKLGLSQDLPVVLVFGGSKGARSINRAVLGMLPGLLETTQIIHLTGHLDWDEVQAIGRGLEHRLAERYHPYIYLHEEMGAALAAANLAVCRSGASTLGELPLYGLPAILVPYPYAWRYQKVNADFLERHGAAVILPDNRLAENLDPLLKRLLTDARRLEEMRSAMLQLARPQAAARLAGLIHSMASGSSQKDHNHA